MGKPGSTRNVGGIEENILAILGSSEAKDNQDAYEDRITFLEAVRAASISFQLLIQELVDATGEANFQASETKSLAKMLLFQYLINVLEWDFLPHTRIYKETMNWVVLRELLLNMFLVSRKVNHKSLMKDCLTIMCNLYQTHAGFTDDLICSENSVAQPAESLLRVFDEPKWKLKIVVQYLWKYIAEPSIRSRRSNGPPYDDASFN